jgi:hypothetical protein
MGFRLCISPSASADADVFPHFLQDSKYEYSLAMIALQSNAAVVLDRWDVQLQSYATGFYNIRVRVRMLWSSLFEQSFTKSCYIASWRSIAGSTGIFQSR